MKDRIHVLNAMKELPNITAIEMGTSVWDQHALDHVVIWAMNGLWQLTHEFEFVFDGPLVTRELNIVHSKHTRHKG